MKTGHLTKDYHVGQQVMVRLGLSPDPRYGDISDLDPKRWDYNRMMIASLGRGQNPRWGDVSDLDPTQWSHETICRESLDRGCQPSHGVRTPQAEKMK